MNQIKRSIVHSLNAWSRIRASSITAASAREPEDESPANADSSAQMATVHRLAIIYLMLPLLIWLVGWFEGWFGIPLAVLTLLGLWSALRPTQLSLHWQDLSGALRLAARPTTVILLLIALAWVMATSAGGIFDVNDSDWYKLRSLLLDLVRNDWPAEPLKEFSNHLGTPILLRHYLGYFMVPGLIGKGLGPAALNWAVPLWTWCGAGLLLLFTREFRRWGVAVAAFVLIFFSGMDIVRILLLEGWDWIGLSVSLDGWPRIELGKSHLEWDNRFGVKLQYSSHMVGMMWVPKHFLAAGLYTLLLLQLGRCKRFLAASGVLVAAAPFWSPFVAIGLLPLVLVVFWRQGILPFLSWQNLLLAPAIAAVLFVYLASGAGGLEQGWIWETQFDSLHESIALPIIYVTEFLVMAGLLIYLRPQLRTDALFIVCLATLLLLPLYSVGRNNDWLMRGAMPSLLVLSYICARVLADPPSATRVAQSLRYRATVGLLVVLLAIGAVTPLFEIVRASNNHNFSGIRYEELGPEHSILGYIEKLPLEILGPQVAAHGFPEWYLRLLGFDVANEPQVKGDLIVQAKYDVYLNDRTLVFLGEACSLEEYETHYFVHVTPLNSSDLPTGRAFDNLSFSFRSKHAIRLGTTCLAVRELTLPYVAGHIVMGQLNAEQIGHTWLAHYFSDGYRGRLLTEAGEPIARARYNVYLHREMPASDTDRPEQRRLLYYRAGCGKDETNTRFFL